MKTLFDGRNVFVVGAGASFGPHLVRGFLAKGDRVLASTRNGQAIVPEAGVAWVSLDLLHPASIQRVMSEDVPAFGALDLVVMTPGILPGRSLADYDDELMAEVMQANLLSQASLLRRLLPHLCHGAQVWFVSSISADRGSFDPIYAASKAGINALVKSLATWLAPGLRVNAIAPALIEGSAMYDAMSPDRRAHHLSTTPTRRLTTPAEVAEVILSLCEPAWSNLNGQIIRLNGGAHV